MHRFTQHPQIYPNTQWNVFDRMDIQDPATLEEIWKKQHRIFYFVTQV